MTKKRIIGIIVTIPAIVVAGVMVLNTPSQSDNNGLEKSQSVASYRVEDLVAGKKVTLFDQNGSIVLEEHTYIVNEFDTKFGKYIHIKTTKTGDTTPDRLYYLHQGSRLDTVFILNSKEVSKERRIKDISIRENGEAYFSVRQIDPAECGKSESCSRSYSDVPPANAGEVLREYIYDPENKRLREI